MKLRTMTILATAVLCLSTFAQVQAETESLRGKGIEGSSVETDLKKWQPGRDPIPGDYVQQPPLVPHSIDSYKINLKFNKCLTCHSWANYEKARATKVSQTHFQDRDENVRANIDGSRYFCNQCQVSQVNAPPLIENTFTPVEAIRQ